MTDEELLQALMPRLNEIAQGDVLMTVDIHQLEHEFPDVDRDQLMRVLELARQMGLIGVKTGFVLITEAGIDFAQGA